VAACNDVLGCRYGVELRLTRAAAVGLGDATLQSRRE
jgi:hypothetical protein